MKLFTRKTGRRCPCLGERSCGRKASTSREGYKPGLVPRPVSCGFGELAPAPACQSGKVLAALLGLFLALAAGVEDLSLKDFDFVQFSGIWYEIAFAPNLEPQGSPRMKRMGAVMVQQEGPRLALTSVSDHMSRCVKQKRRAVKGGAPGKFKLPMESGGKEVTVVATDYKTYAIMNIVFHKGGKAHSVLKLYSWMVEHNEKAMDRFLVKAVEHGLSAVDVQLLSKDLTCVNLLP